MVKKLLPLNLFYQKKTPLTTHQSPFFRTFAAVRRQTLIFILLFVFIFVMAGLPSLRFIHIVKSEREVSDSIVPADSIDSLNLSPSTLNKVDSLNPAPSTINQVDTTQMDSLQLLIYKRNKAIDDSLRLDSLNRQRKNSIEAPVEYSAQDSMTYEAETGVAHLYGSAVVSYENMNLQSDQIHMSLDSNIVRASGTSDSLGVVKGSPIFKMGSDTYENDTIAFNFKTKKGLITGVYTEQDEGFLTS